MHETTNLPALRSSTPTEVVATPIPDTALLLTTQRIEASITAKKLVKQAIADVLVEGVDYGVVKGCGDTPILLKPGIQQILSLLNVYADPQVTTTELPGNHAEYNVRCPVRQIGSDAVVAVGFGSCSTLEKKYRYRLSDRCCPECDEESLIKLKEGKGFWCSPKKGGCNANFPADDERITEQETGYTENRDISDARNTCLKMAIKRAKKDAVESLMGGWDYALSRAVPNTAANRRPGSAPSQGNAKPAPAARKSKADQIADCVATWFPDRQEKFHEFVSGHEANGATHDDAVIAAMEEWKAYTAK